MGVSRVVFVLTLKDLQALTWASLGKADVVVSGSTSATWIFPGLELAEVWEGVSYKPRSGLCFWEAGALVLGGRVGAGSPAVESLMSATPSFWDFLVTSPPPQPRVHPGGGAQHLPAPSTPAQFQLGAQHHCGVGEASWTGKGAVLVLCGVPGATWDGPTLWVEARCLSPERRAGGTAGAPEGRPGPAQSDLDVFKATSQNSLLSKSHRLWAPSPENSPWTMGASGCSHTLDLNASGQRGNLTPRHCGLMGLSPDHRKGASSPHPFHPGCKARGPSSGMGIGWEWEWDESRKWVGIGKVLLGFPGLLIWEAILCAVPGRGCEPEERGAGLRNSSAWCLHPFSQVPTTMAAFSAHGLPSLRVSQGGLCFEIPPL